MNMSLSSVFVKAQNADRVGLVRMVKGASPFLYTDGIVLVLVLLFPILALWLPNSIVQSVLN